MGRQRVPYGRRRSQHGDLWLPEAGGSGRVAALELLDGPPERHPDRYAALLA